MSEPLTSWKKIARYLGKGVRTVQRWERELGLPVRRPNSAEKHLVVALPDELDAWFSQSLNVRQERETVAALRAHIEALQGEIERLKTENQRLKSESPIQTRKAESRPPNRMTPREPFDTP